MRIYVSSADTGLTSKQRLAIAKKSTDPKELSRLAYDNAASVRWAVFQNEHTPQKVVDQLAREYVDDDYPQVRRAVAQRTNDLNLLAKLADDENVYVRQAVAEETDDPNILAKLADDADWLVRKAVAKKTDDPNLIAKLADDRSTGVRWEVAENTNDLNILAKLADDRDMHVRMAVAQHTDDPDILAKLADDGDPNVRLAVAEKTDDLNILAKLSDDENWRVRKVVARRTTDLDILAKLAEDDDEDVRKVARKRYNAVASRSTESRKQPQSDWSIPLYSINNYSEIEGEITQVISDAANEFARKYMGESAQVEVAPGAYDDSAGVVNIHVGENTYTIDVEDILPPATSKQKKRDCVKSLVTWMQNNLPAATDETMTTM